MVYPKESNDHLVQGKSDDVIKSLVGSDDVVDGKGS